MRDRGPNETLTFELPEAPLVSVIIPAHGKERFTFNCLRSVRRHRDEGYAFEIIVVDDGSPGDATREMLRAVHGIRVIANSENEGFIAACNRGASAARGALLLFLNNDTVVQPGWLSQLVRRAQSDERIGAVGSKLVRPDGSVSEAGAIVWRDGSAWNYGRGCSFSDPALNYARDVDYSSAASLLVTRSAFLDAGGFDERYAPAYYEDVDLCFALRSRNLRVVYEPLSVVVHFEGATAGRSTRFGSKRYQELNKPKFAQKWRDVLCTHSPPNLREVESAARRLCGSPRVLVVDSFVPFTDRDAGSIRIFRIMTLMRELGCHVLFLPDDGKAHEPYATHLRDLGIELIAAGNAKKLLGRYVPLVQIAWLCRPELANRYLSTLRKGRAPKIVYDTIDLHFLRLAGEEAVTGRQTDWRSYREAEMRIARTADATVVTSPAEIAILEREGIARVRSVPIVQPVMHNVEVVPWSARSGLVFVGNYTHAPNVDAAIHFCRDILPMIVTALPGVRLSLVGNEPPPAILALAGERVEVVGRVPDVGPYLNRARVLVAPLRFGAGMKGKIVESMAYGLPVVTTKVGAEGIDERGIILAGTPDEFARATISVYVDDGKWAAVARAGRIAAERYAPERVREDVRAVLAMLG